jgi:hypothetical protein
MSNQLPGELVYCVHKLSSKFNEVIIIPLSDVHYGNPMFSAHHLQRAIDFILSKPNHYTLLNGDLCECVLKSSKGDVYSQEFNPQAQRDFIIDAFMPLAKAGRILALCQGNHEERIYREAGIDICSDMAKAWGCWYGAEEVLIRVEFGSGNYRTDGRPYPFYIHATHGYGGARTKGAKNVKVERQSHQVHADVYLQSHDHDASVQAGVYLLPNTRAYERDNFTIGSMTAVDKKLVKTGAFLKRGGYAARKGYDPVSMGLVYVKLQGNNGRAQVRVEM